MLPTVTVWGFALDLGLVPAPGVPARPVGGRLVPGVPGQGPLSPRPSAMPTPDSPMTSSSTGMSARRGNCSPCTPSTTGTSSPSTRPRLRRATSACSSRSAPRTTTGRHVYRSLAEFHETDVGRFHRWLSLIILAVALAFSAGGMLAWWNKPGEWLLVIATGISLVLLWLELRRAPETSRNDADPVEAAARDELWLLDRDSPVP